MKMLYVLFFSRYRLILALITFFLAVRAQAGVSIANAPLFLTVNVLPALIMAVDDSGSMDSEILVRSNDGALWWNTNDESFVGQGMSDQHLTGAINFNKFGAANDSWKKFVYLFPNGTGQSAGRRAYADSSHDHYAVPPIGPFAYVRSPEYNFSYFNPRVKYEPWPDLGGYTFEDSTPNAAKTDPIIGSATLDLTVTRESDSNNHVFRMYPGMTIPAGTKYKDWSNNLWITADVERPIQSGEEQGVPISYFPATFYLSATADLPSSFGYIPSQARINGVTGTSALMDGFTPNGLAMIRYEIKPENFQDANAYELAMQNFANWFTYYRKRNIAVRGAIGSAFQDVEGFRIGAYRINKVPSPASGLSIYDLSILQQRSEFFENIYKNFYGTGGTPNREAVNHMRAQFKRTDQHAPIQESCQRNFAVLFTDGYSNTWTGAGVGNRDGGMGEPFADSVSNTMADIAAALYLDNPRSSFQSGQVVLPKGCNVPSPPLALDCNDDLHVNFYALTLGAPGTIFKVDLDATADPYKNPPSWPTSFSNRNPVHVDDLWHATLNSRGSFLDVSVPSELGARFREMLEAIAARLTTTATAAAASTATLQTGTRLYSAGFRSTDWTGTLGAFALESDGSLGETIWDAEVQISKQIGSRKLFSSDGSTGIFLAWDELSASQQEALNRSPADNSFDGLGKERLAWLGGSDVALSSFRSRSESGQFRLLGDIVNSNPVFQPKAYFAPTRPDMIYVGANDGMLHAFNAETGAEVFSYLPSELLLPELEDESQSFARINRLMDLDYLDRHRYFVDGTSTVANVQLNGIWKSILVGTMGAGGRTVFALDVTDPVAFSASDILWEFTDPDLGQGVSHPAIMTLGTGSSGVQKAVVFGNGYNGESDTAVLFAVDLEDGTLISKIDTEVGSAESPNGLAAAVGSDWTEGDGRVRQIYAGDLQGNLWRFDVSSNNLSQWENTRNHNVLFQAQDPTGTPQPITVRPQVAINSMYDPVILFGTGSYFRTSDDASMQVQSLYGIADDGSVGLTRDDLLAQEILWQGDHSFTNTETNETFSYTLREVSAHELSSAIREKGWYLDLYYDDAEGERVVSSASFPSGQKRDRVRFSTLIPDDDPCGTGRTGYVYEILSESGGQSEEPGFDLNRDHGFDDDDGIAIIGEADSLRLPSAVQYGTGTPITVVVDGGVDHVYVGDDGDGTPLDLRGAEVVGRQSWQQLR